MEKGPEKNLKKALNCYEEAMNSGHVGALYQLGGMYYHGEGVKKDRKRALSIYKEAGDKGESGAQLQCGWMYYRGEGTKKDRQKALRWFERAGGGGCTEAWLICGRMYYKGAGTDKDLCQSRCSGARRQRRHQTVRSMQRQNTYAAGSILQEKAWKRIGRKDFA